MDTFIITGANTEPAQSIARRLCEIGARVYGIAGIFPENTFKHEEFFPVACDITNPHSVATEAGKILTLEHNICGLILATQFLETDAFEMLPPDEISLAVNALISTPLVITRLLLPSLIATRGSIIAISPNTVTPRGHVLNNIMEAAMKTFTGTLFGELRDTGIRTCHILLQNNPGPQDPATQYTNTPQSRIHADIVADTVESVLNLRENNALTQIVLRPQATRETPHIPISAEPKIRTLQAIQLPPAKNFPPEEKSIYTEKYRRPDYAPKIAKGGNLPEEDDDGLADDYVDPELRYLIKQPNQRSKDNHGNTSNQHNDQNRSRPNQYPQPNQRQQNINANSHPQQQAQQFDENGNPISRKRKRHRNRNRNRNKNRDDSQSGGMHIRPPEVFVKNEEQTEQKNKERKDDAHQATTICTPDAGEASKSLKPPTPAPAATQIKSEPALTPEKKEADVKGEEVSEKKLPQKRKPRATKAEKPKKEENPSAKPPKKTRKPRTPKATPEA